MCKYSYFVLTHEQKLNSLTLLVRFLYVRLLDLKDGYTNKHFGEGFF